MTVVIANVADDEAGLPAITALGSSVEQAMEVYVLLVNMHSFKGCVENTNSCDGYYNETILTTANMFEYCDLEEHMQEVYGVTITVGEV